MSLSGSNHMSDRHFSVSVGNAMTTRAVIRAGYHRGLVMTLYCSQ